MMPFRLAALAVAFLVCRPAAAEVFNLRYQTYWGGLHAADFVLTLERGVGPFTNAFVLETRGLLDWFIRLRVDAASRGAHPDPDTLRPGSYRSHYRNRRRERVLSITFDPADGPAETVIETLSSSQPDSEDYGGEDQLPAEFRAGVVDPLTALAEAVFRVGRHLAGGPALFRLKVFDGRRRFDLDGAFGGRVRRDILGTVHDLYHLRLTTIPVAGFKEVHKLLWDGSVFDLYLSADGRLIPRQIVAVGPGPVISLVEECDGPCRLSPE